MGYLLLKQDDIDTTHAKSSEFADSVVLATVDDASASKTISSWSWLQEAAAIASESSVGLNLGPSEHSARAHGVNRNLAVVDPAGNLLILRLECMRRSHLAQVPRDTEGDYLAIAPPERCDPRDASNEDMRKWRQEVEQFERMRSTLWKDRNLRHRFVAIHSGKVVDHDGDKFTLARRVSQTFPGKVVLISRVQRGTRVVEMPSPELD